MSYYCEEKVLRCPVEKYWGERACTWEIEKEYPELFNDCTNQFPRFEIALTEGAFIDYVLSRKEGSGEFGTARKLTESEKVKYKEVWEKLIPDIDMNDVHYVYYSWYNCSEAPDYYECEEI